MNEQKQASQGMKIRGGKNKEKWTVMSIDICILRHNNSQEMGKLKEVKNVHYLREL